MFLTKKFEFGVLFGRNETACKRSLSSSQMAHSTHNQANQPLSSKNRNDEPNDSVFKLGLEQIERLNI